MYYTAKNFTRVEEGQGGELQKRDEILSRQKFHVLWYSVGIVITVWSQLYASRTVFLYMYMYMCVEHSLNIQDME